MTNFRYKAVQIRQTETGDNLVLFAAPATEIDSWVGIPQKQQLSEQGGETTGFQREENKKRIKDLQKFYENEKNIIQNPLLCARRISEIGTVSFEAIEESEEDGFLRHGFISIEVESLEDKKLLELLRLVKQHLETRVPPLQSATVSSDLINQIKLRANISDDSEDIEDDEESDDTEESDSPAEDISLALDESHIQDFWEQIAARVQVLEELGDSFTEDIFEGFSKEAMISFLRPVVLVDGQHRLRGAISAAQEIAQNDDNKDEIERRVISGEEVDSIHSDIKRRVSRKLPISLLMSEDPAEQVFQFVVVNQKAVPIGSALLGTIVSTSLSNEELERVSQRLKDAQIKLDDSRVVAFLTRSQDSPFFNKVEKGLESDKSGDLLPWTVLRSLASIFQNLKDGKLFHSKNDYAAKWKREHLESSAIIADWESKGYKEALEYWSAADGPWRDVFIAFWSAVRDKLANTSDSEVNNYWGSARKSLIFNKISLTILAADFFQFLCEMRKTIDSADAIPEIVEDWLKDVSPNYFNRPWDLRGTKKDNPGIRKRWAKEWEEYRKDPVRLPNVSVYSVVYN